MTTEPDDLQGCEHCSKEFSVEDMTMMGDCWFCTECYADFKKAFDACEHKWVADQDDFGEPGKYCEKCHGFVLDNAERATARASRIKELIAKYPEPWVIEKEPHNYNDGTKEFTHVRYYSSPDFAKGERVCIEIGSHVTPDLAELLVLLREYAADL